MSSPWAPAAGWRVTASIPVISAKELSSSDISFMAPEVAANVVYAAKIIQAEDPQKARQEAIEEMRLASAPWRAAGQAYLDDVIDPRDTRKTIIRGLELARGKHKGMSRRLLANWPTTF